MKTIIAGGRNYEITLADYKRLDKFYITEVVSGGSSGADRGGEVYAAHMGYPVKKFPADWEKHGKAAGPIRNKQMAEYADAVVLFPGGKGTESMYQEAKKAGIKIYDWRG